MFSRRDFLKGAAALSSGAFVPGSVPEAIARALDIDPVAGTTFLDAEHIVILMQENRSFDHSYGALRGVRGFRDPRVHRQPNNRPVWLQTDATGATFAPFRLDINQSNATWLGGLPHTWPDQIDARNGGRYDNWLIAKPKKDLPFTLGHYSRDDIPFYYALADGFTVCDQAFCSSITGTTSNRLFLWTGNNRRDVNDPPRVNNGDTTHDAEAAWPTFPERLEDAGVSWRIYQNEIGDGTGFQGEEDAWLGNFTDNPIEWFSQYRARFGKSHRALVAKQVDELPARIAGLETEITGLTGTELTAKQKTLTTLRTTLEKATAEQQIYHDAAWDALTTRDRSLHERAFTTNAGDPQYRSLAKHTYQDGDTARDVQIPAGDTLFQFRCDVETGALPAVSWLVAPQNFSDHPSAPWYGAWYVSEVMNILTASPEIWKKTIFVLCYDENDGYFDHVPPFVAPHPDRPETGRVSDGINTAIDWGNVHGRDHSIGLGFRVPLVVASPWSRGGCVNSEVVDHTSIIRLVETWLAGKGKAVKEENISDWRRTICGDLTSVFQPYKGEAPTFPSPLERNTTVEHIHSARFRPKPATPATAGESALAEVHAQQEAGTRPSAPLNHELHVNADRVGAELVLVMEARSDAFGAKATGSAFNAYGYGNEMHCRSYAVRAGASLEDRWPIDGGYDIRVDGPNGFMRSFIDTAAATNLQVTVNYRSGKRANGSIEIHLVNGEQRPTEVVIQDEAYGMPTRRVGLGAGRKGTSSMKCGPGGWYDFSVQSGALTYRYAGRVENGKWSITDPAMGGA